MKILQNKYCVSCGMDDTLLASVYDVRQYAGKSALSAIDTIDILFSRKQLWKSNRIGNEFIASIMQRDQQLKPRLESFFCSQSR